MSPRILIVEDEALVALEMEAIIEDLGLSPIGIAPDKRTALDLARSKPDIALVDLHLRDGLTGPDIGRELAEQGVSVVFVTANPRLVAQGVPGAYGVIEKPTEETLIADAIAYAMRRRTGLQATPPASLIAF
ncbi:MAG: response regulator [Bosea sp. (in: a-proteobacteria)]